MPGMSNLRPPLAEREAKMKAIEDRRRTFSLPRDIFDLATKVHYFEDSLPKLPAEPYVDEALRKVLPEFERLVAKISERLAATVRPGPH